MWSSFFCRLARCHCLSASFACFFFCSSGVESVVAPMDDHDSNTLREPMDLFQFFLKPHKGSGCRACRRFHFRSSLQQRAEELVQRLAPQEAAEAQARAAFLSAILPGVFPTIIANDSPTRLRLNTIFASRLPSTAYPLTTTPSRSKSMAWRPCMEILSETKQKSFCTCESCVHCYGTVYTRRETKACSLRQALPCDPLLERRGEHR
jgi:hypothetical protein